MELWTVGLRDPLYLTRRGSKILHSKKIEASTEYGAKKEFFTSLLKEYPNLPKAPFSTILPYLSIQRVNTKKPKTSEYPPEDFFQEARNLFRKLTTEEELESSRYLNYLILLVTEEGRESGVIPQKCPICKRPTKKLEIHHWNSQKSQGDGGKYKNYSLINGFYRRMCHSCNVSLGHIFKQQYPLDWTTQLEALKIYSKDFPKTYTTPIGEEWWSLLSEKEWKRIKHIWDTIPRKLLRESFNNPKNRKLHYQQPNP